MSVPGMVSARIQPVTFSATYVRSDMGSSGPRSATQAKGANTAAVSSRHTQSPG